VNVGAIVKAGASPFLCPDKINTVRSGRWVMDAEHSSYGRMPPSEQQRGEMKSFMKLTTDGRESLNEINGNEFRSTSHWDGPTLITMVTGDRGMRMVEVRSVSADGKTQTVETYMGEIRGNRQMKPVMVKKDR
jgi:hypothetical protein